MGIIKTKTKQNQIIQNHENKHLNSNKTWLKH